MNERNTILIVQQVDPPIAHPFRLIEVFPTVDGFRSRICEGCWGTFEGAEIARQRHIKARNS